MATVGHTAFLVTHGVSSYHPLGRKRAAQEILDTSSEVPSSSETGELGWEGAKNLRLTPSKTYPLAQAWSGKAMRGKNKGRSQRPWKSTWAQTKGIDREGAKAGGRRRFLLRHS